VSSVREIAESEVKQVRWMALPWTGRRGDATAPERARAHIEPSAAGMPSGAAELSREEGGREPSEVAPEIAGGRKLLRREGEVGLGLNESDHFASPRDRGRTTERYSIASCVRGKHDDDV
jgi:hypothetical protein